MSIIEQIMHPDNFNALTNLFVSGPPVIVNSSIIKDHSEAECVLSVQFYSFDEKTRLIWYKNGRLLHSSERQRQNVGPATNYVNMHDIAVPVRAKVATLHLKPGCDVDTSVYRLTVKTAHFSTSHTFEENGEYMSDDLFFDPPFLLFCHVSIFNVLFASALFRSLWFFGFLL